MYLHSDTLYRFRSNKYVVLLLNVACFAVTQHIAIVYSFVSPDRVSSTHSTEFESSMLTTIRHKLKNYKLKDKWVRVTRSLVLYVLQIVAFSICPFFLPLCCLSFFDLRIIITLCYLKTFLDRTHCQWEYMLTPICYNFHIPLLHNKLITLQTQRHHPLDQSPGLLYKWSLERYQLLCSLFCSNER